MCCFVTIGSRSFVAVCTTLSALFIDNNEIDNLHQSQWESGKALLFRLGSWGWLHSRDILTWPVEYFKKILVEIPFWIPGCELFSACLWFMTHERRCFQAGLTEGRPLGLLPNCLNCLLWGSHGRDVYPDSILLPQCVLLLQSCTSVSTVTGILLVFFSNQTQFNWHC